MKGTNKGFTLTKSVNITSEGSLNDARTYSDAGITESVFHCSEVWSGEVCPKEGEAQKCKARYLEIGEARLIDSRNENLQATLKLINKARSEAGEAATDTATDTAGGGGVTSAE